MEQQGATTRHAHDGLDDTGAHWHAGPLEAPVGWALVVAGLCAGIVWTALVVVGGGVLMDSPTPTAAFAEGARHGALTVILPFLAIGSVRTGLGLLRRGTQAVDTTLAAVVYGTTAVAAAGARMWPVALGSAMVLAALVLLRRRGR